MGRLSLCTSRNSMCCRRLFASWYKNFYVPGEKRTQAGARAAGTPAGSCLSPQGPHRGCHRGRARRHLLCRLLSAFAPLRQLRPLPGAEGREDVWRLLVPALRRPESHVRRFLQVCSLHRMRHPGHHVEDHRRVHRCRHQALSHLAVSSHRRARRGRHPPGGPEPAHRMPAAMSAGSHRLFLTIAALAILGIAVSGISLDHHFRKTKTGYCDFGQSFNCDLVYRSEAETPAILLVGSVAGLGFALYLTYIEKFVLFAWCMLCLASLAIISIITLLCLLLVCRPQGLSQAE